MQRFSPPHALPPTPLVLPAARPAGGAATKRLSFDEAVEMFIGRTRRTRSGSRHTERAYRGDLRHFRDFLTDRTLALHQVRRRDAEAYTTLLSSQVHARTVKRHISTLRSFFKFLRGIEEVSASPFELLDLPGFDRKSETHKVLTDSELERLAARLSADVSSATRRFETVSREKRTRAFALLLVAARRRACLTLMAFAGLRVEEVMTLPRRAFKQQRDGMSLTFSGKGNKTRTVPLVGFAYPAMFDWLTVRRLVPTSADEVFITITGRGVQYAQLERSCARLGRQIKARVRLTPHVLRRTFATLSLKASGDIRSVQELLGHASIQTTELYTHVDEESLRKLVESAGLASGIGQREHLRGPIVQGVA
jgi:site-specific recombinase XerD